MTSIRSRSALTLLVLLLVLAILALLLAVWLLYRREIEKQSTRATRHPAAIMVSTERSCDAPAHIDLRC